MTEFARLSLVVLVLVVLVGGTFVDAKKDNILEGRCSTEVTSYSLYF